MAKLNKQYTGFCPDEGCPGYGKRLVDRGYGTPVCITTKWRHELYPGEEDLPMDPMFLEE